MRSLRRAPLFAAPVALMAVVVLRRTGVVMVTMLAAALVMRGLRLQSGVVDLTHWLHVNTHIVAILLLWTVLMLWVIHRDERARSLLDEAVRRGEELRVLDVSKVESGRLELEVVSLDLAKLVDDAVSTVEPLARSGGSLPPAPHRRRGAGPGQGQRRSAAGVAAGRRREGAVGSPRAGPCAGHAAQRHPRRGGRRRGALFTLRVPTGTPR